MVDNLIYLSNELTYKDGAREINRIRKKMINTLPKKKDLFYVVMYMITFYKFRNQAKKLIFNFFEPFLTHNQIFFTLDLE